MKYISFVYSSLVSFLTGALLVFLLWGALLLELSVLARGFIAVFGPRPYAKTTVETAEGIGFVIVTAIALATFFFGVWVWKRLMKLITQSRFYPVNEYTMDIAGVAAFLSLAPSYIIWPTAFFVP